MDSLSEIFKIDNPRDYKVHVARHNGYHQPLDIFVDDEKKWLGWNTYHGKKNEFNRRYILSLIDFYSEYRTWVFGGIFEVLERYGPGEEGYKIKPIEPKSPLIGRLKLTGEISRGRSFLLENIELKLTVSELLKERYEGTEFPGYNNVSFDYEILEPIFQNERVGWKAALHNVHGIYLIVDRQTGRKYVGAAYGEEGIWSRWSAYLHNGHGGNTQLRELASTTDIEYRRKNFRITLLESWPHQMDEKTILNRESYWKDTLLTRGEFGYNSN